MSIGRSPFRSVTTRGKVTCDAADWNMHMSNSSYARALDKARFSWLLEVVGPAMGQEKVWSPLASTSYTFFKEIPVLAQYEIDVHLVSYDHKWVSFAFVSLSVPSLYSLSTHSPTHRYDDYLDLLRRQIHNRASSWLFRANVELRRPFEIMFQDRSFEAEYRAGARSLCIGNG